MIATALISEPDLSISDEPATSLDVTVQAQIIQLIKTMQTQKDMSVILITHNLPSPR
ncbi:MAG: Oligopeptide transport ATP-binding protein OppD [Candidatus Carbobacillus altaicus]|uniref:Oligopeptide transport ATP-binding protein OppD n=1 Tax=Candidatus Carbonibacillus altaicus TaxID=2163959 RepID=A0A2R6Y3T5_9BACL|nr:MAG: Oligopeptide transport ATP-binding protein OppD [Candidatus Carbobacillus altaicus]